MAFHLNQSKIQSSCHGLQDLISFCASLHLLEQEETLLFLKHTIYSPASRSLNWVLFAKNAFPLHKHVAQSLVSFRSLLRCHFWWPPSIPLWSFCLPLLYCFSYHLSPLGMFVTHLPFFGFLSSQENVSLRAGAFYFVYFCVSSAWLIVGTCASRADGQAAHVPGLLEPCWWGKLMETGAITGPLLLIALQGNAKRSSKYRC